MCPLCKLTILNSAEGMHFAHALNVGILLMLGFSFGILILFAFFIAKTRWKNLNQAQKGLQVLMESNPYFQDKRRFPPLLWGIGAVMIFFIILVNVLGAWINAQTQHSSKLPNYGKVPNFVLVEKNGEKFSEKNLNGKIWVADFFVSRCKDECPLLTDRMAQLQKDFSSDSHVVLVSFSVDGKYDTPKVLQSFAKRYDAKEGKWYFLTGKQASVVSLMEKDFHLPIVLDPHEKFTANYDPDIAHSLKFVLVDSKGRIRGYYDGNDPLSVSRIPRDISALEKENS
jgi:protein SCO1/2